MSLDWKRLSDKVEHGCNELARLASAIFVKPVRWFYAHFFDRYFLQGLRDLFVAFYPARVVGLAILAMAVIFGVTDQGLNLLNGFLADAVSVYRSIIANQPNYGLMWQVGIGVIVFAIFVFTCWVWTFMSCSISHPDEERAILAARVAYPSVLMLDRSLNDRGKHALKRANFIFSCRFIAPEIILGISSLVLTIIFLRAGLLDVVELSGRVLWTIAIAGGAFLALFIVLIFGEVRYNWLTSVIVTRWERALKTANSEAVWQTLKRRGQITIASLFFVLMVAALLMSFDQKVMDRPETFKLAFGSLGAILLCLSILTTVGTILTISARRSQTPMLIIVIILLAVSSQFSNNHNIRWLPAPHDDTQKQPLAARALLADAVKQRYRSLQATACEKDCPPPKLFLVAAAGGGLRAGYWTARTLDAIEAKVADMNARLEQSRQRRFSDHLFAISSVSGGSLGAMVYTSLLHAQADTRNAPFDMSEKIDQFFAQDYLGPIVGAFFINDPMYLLTAPFRFLSWKPFFTGDDRAASLERSWERGWARLGLHGPRLRDDFLGLFAAPSQRFPYLMFNGTVVETGERIITTPLILDSGPGALHRDFFTLSEMSIASSTAVNLSARFPYIGPAGRFEVQGFRGASLGLSVVDGGYYENFGSATAHEILSQILAADWSELGSPPEVHVIVISSDPILPDYFDHAVNLKHPRPMVALSNPDEERKRKEEAAQQFKYRGVSDDLNNETGVPLETIMNTRVAHGTASTRALRDGAASRIYHLRMCDNFRSKDNTPRDGGLWQRAVGAVADFLQPKTNGPPLGWVMSLRAQNDIKMFLKQCDNDGQIQKIAEALLGIGE